MKLFKNTGDGSCAYHAVAVSFYEALLGDTLPIAQKKEEISEFLQNFAAFHPNFNPITLDNLKRWCKHYCSTPRDVELLISPVLRLWFEKEHHFNNNLQQTLLHLPKRSHIHAEDESLRFLCDKFGFNLSLETDSETQDFCEIAPQPGPKVSIKHHNNHFDAYVSDNFSKKFIPYKDSFILSHAGNVEAAYSYDKHPLPAVNEIVEDYDKDAVTFYAELKRFQHELQNQALKIQSQELALEDNNDAKDIQNNPIYAFNPSNGKDKHIPDNASLILMFKLLQEDAKELLEAKQALESHKQQRSLKRN